AGVDDRAVHRDDRRAAGRPSDRAGQSRAPSAVALARGQVARQVARRHPRGVARDPPGGRGVRRAGPGRRRRVGGQAVLIAMPIAWLAAAVATPTGLAMPDRLTAGTGHQYLGAEAPGGRELYFASDQASTTQIFVQDLQTGVPQLAFDELADATWPRPSPDGHHLLYISYREDAAGDVCVRTIEGRPGARTFGE